MPDWPGSMPQNKYSPTILIVRPDRMGDVILSTPVVSALRARFPSAWIGMLVQPALRPILGDLPGLDEVIAMPAISDDGVRATRNALTDVLRKNGLGRPWDGALVLKNDPSVALALKAAGIGFRVGPRGPLYSYFLYNKGLRQRRSQVQRHEAEYGLQLAEFFAQHGAKRWGLDLASVNMKTLAHLPTQVKLSSTEMKAAEARLVAQGWLSDRPTVAIHPGMGGSALNWNFRSYADLAVRILEAGDQVVLTGGVAEQTLVMELKRDIEQRLVGKSRPSPVIFISEPGETAARLGSVFQHASVVVAPSTGPLHLAVALGIPVVTLYPPIRVQSAKRWGPYRARQSVVHVPSVPCPEVFRCAGAACPYYFCMDQISVEKVYESVQSLLRSKPEENLRG